MAFAEPGKGWLISLLGSSTSAQPAADRPMLLALVFEAARTLERTAPRAVPSSRQGCALAVGTAPLGWSWWWPRSLGEKALISSSEP